MWKSEDNLQELTLHLVGPEDGTQALRLDSKCLYPLSHLATQRLSHFLSFLFTHPPPPAPRPQQVLFITWPWLD